jgi:hypothetical protein
MKWLAFIGVLFMSACSAHSAATLQTSAPKPAASDTAATDTAAGKTPEGAAVVTAHIETSSPWRSTTNEAKATGGAPVASAASSRRPGKQEPSGDVAAVQAATVQAVLQAMAQRDVANFCLYRLASADAAQGRSDAATATTAACADLIRAYARSVGAADLQSASALFPPLPAIPETELPAP